jgi:hypothetical protein
MFGVNIVQYSQALHVIVCFISEILFANQNFLDDFLCYVWVSRFVLTTLPYNTHCFKSKLRRCVRSLLFFETS